MPQIGQNGKYRWNDMLQVKCLKKDKERLIKKYVEWQEKHNIELSFTVWFNCVMFPEFFKSYKSQEALFKRKLKKLATYNKHRKDFV